MIKLLQIRVCGKINHVWPCDAVMCVCMCDAVNINRDFAVELHQRILWKSLKIPNWMNEGHQRQQRKIELRTHIHTDIQLNFEHVFVLFRSFSSRCNKWIFVVVVNHTTVWWWNNQQTTTEPNTPVECRNHRELNTDTHPPRPHTAVLVHIEWGSGTGSGSGNAIIKLHWHASNRDTILQNWTHHTHSYHIYYPVPVAQMPHGHWKKWCEKIRSNKECRIKYQNYEDERYANCVEWMGGRRRRRLYFLSGRATRSCMHHQWISMRGQEWMRDRTRGR